MSVTKDKGQHLSNFVEHGGFRHYAFRRTPLRILGRRGLLNLKAMMYPQFVDHLVFRVADLSKSERFYTMLLGQPPHRTEDSIMYQVGDTRLFFTRCEQPQPGPYDKEEVGLNHLAFGVRTLEELQVIQEQLGRAGIPNSGIKIDRYGQKEFIWLDDPDNMRIEFYLRPDDR
jgi:catechol-2,3-dioxygenase